ncbi:DUF262 domain-containing protein [Geodermatophilus sp. SYSU D01045]
MTTSSNRTDPVDVAFDDVPSEEEDGDAALRSYEIVTFPADYTLSVLVDKWRRRQVRIPEFQRDFVWKQNQASRLIESFLLGLPVPAIFLYTDRSDRNNQLVVDGQQRLRTIAYFFEGYFGEPNSRGRRQIFRLTGLHEDSPFANKTYADLERDDPGAWNRLNDSVLRAFVIQQLDPSDDTSIYHIFERLNTGGTLLYPQEIRNAVAHGPFNDLLHELNRWDDWRAIYGSPQPDRRKRDIELILRVMALSESIATYAKPMKDFLNGFMSEHRDPGMETLARLEEKFRRAVKSAQAFGPRPFRRGAGLNAAFFDAVMTALMEAPEGGVVDPDALSAAYAKLLEDERFQETITRSTTDDDVVEDRVRIAKKFILG